MDSIRFPYAPHTASDPLASPPLIAYLGDAPTPEDSHGPHPDHLRAALHQRGQAPRQPRRQPAPVRRLRPLLPRPRPRGPAPLRHRRARHPGRARRRRRRRAGGRLLRQIMEDSEGHSRWLPPVLRPLRPLLQPAEPRAHPALRRPPVRRGPHRRGDGETGLFPRRRPLPARPLHRGHLPQLRLRARPRRPVRELHQAARPHRPHQPPLRHLRLHRPGSPRNQALIPPPEPAPRRDPRLDRQQVRLAHPHHLHRPQVARRRRGPAGPRHHPRPRLGHPGPPRRRALARHGGQGLLRLVRRPHRVHRRHRRMGRRARPRRGRLAALVARGQGRGGRPLRPVHGQGQRALPHPLVPRHPHRRQLRRRRAVEARRLHQVLQLPQLRGRQVLHLPGPRRLHGPGAGDPARRLLALVADGQRARRARTPTSPGRASRPA